MSGFTESVVEDAALVWLGAIGYAVLHGRDISPVGDTLTPNPSLGDFRWSSPDGRGAFAGELRRESGQPKPNLAISRTAWLTS